MRDRFFSWGWWAARVPLVARWSRNAAPAVAEQNERRVQQYLDFLRENGPVPGPAPHVAAPRMYSEAA